MDPRTTITLRLAHAGELFVGPEPGMRRSKHPRSTDDVGATLGESGVERLLQTDSRHAEMLVIRIEQGVVAEEELMGRLRAWCECRMQANATSIGTTRRLGLRATLFALLALAIALGSSWVLKSEVLFGPAGAMRNLLSEAMVIAGWVVLWRPMEMLLFDTIPPARQNGHLRRLLSIPWKLESAAPEQASAEARPVTS